MRWRRGDQHMHLLLRVIRKQYWITFLAVALIVLVNVFCLGYAPPDQATDAVIGNRNSTGSEACASCHRDIYDSYLNTAHFRTSAPATAASIKGSFANRDNRFRYNQFMEVQMEHRRNHFYQVATVGGEEYQREEFSITIGSGRKGQTYLYWKGRSLFELPVSYYVPTNSWVNSPGLPTGMVYFDRQVKSRCLECHATFAKTADLPDGNTVFDPSAIVFGIDCERCHGPATEHIQFHQTHPEAKKGEFIIGFSQLTRQQKIDACALCHSGFRKALKPAFTFKTGDQLNDFSLPNYNTDSSFSLDVHGNQVGLLSSSKCFIASESMTCSSCHNVHREEVNDPKLFSSRCMTCHNGGDHKTCTQPEVITRALNDNCIDCHMPSLPSSKILLEMSDTHKGNADLVRTHRIAIYPQQSDAFLRQLPKNK